MARQIAIVGASGTGKTFSLRTLPPEETIILTPYKIDLSIPGWAKNYKLYTENEPDGRLWKVQKVQDLPAYIRAAAARKAKYIVVEDISHLMTEYLMSDYFRSLAGGKLSYSRFEQFAADMFKGMFGVIQELPDDITVINIFHDDYIETSQGIQRKIRVTAGKMLDEKVDLPSYFTHVIYTEFKRDDKLKQTEKYKFRIVTDGISPAKMPYGVYPEGVELIPNDIMDVINHIVAYANGETIVRNN